MAENSTEDSFAALKSKKAGKIQEKSDLECQFCAKTFPSAQLYICPKCHCRYCCLGCYKDPRHLACSESFYKDSVMEEMKLRGVVESGDGSSSGNLAATLRKLKGDAEAKGEDSGSETDEENFIDIAKITRDSLKLDSEGKDHFPEKELESELNKIGLADADTEALLGTLTEEERRQFEMLAAEMGISGALVEEIE